MHLGLSHKGLILVGSILALELILIGMLLHLMNQVERQGILEEHSKAVVGNTNQIFQLLYDAGTTADRFLKYENPRDKDLYQKEMMQLSRLLRELKPLVQDQPRQLAKVEQVERDAMRGFQMLGELMQTIQKEGHDAAVSQELQNIGEMRGVKSRVMADLRHLMQEQEQLVKDSFAQRIESTRAAKNWMIGGIVLNVVAALCAALLFTKGVTSRLQIMVDNAISLGKGDPLKPRIDGTDEIAKLDQKFHEMADALEESARKRRELVAMITHDLRSPLTSVQGFLSILGRGGYGDVPASVIDRSIMTGMSVARLIALINDLLDLEQMENGKIVLSPELVSTEDIISKSVESVRVFAEQKNIGLVSPSQHFDLFADEDRVVRVLINLISNAIKFSDKDTVIEISVEQIDHMIEFAVIDQGRGISEGEQSSLFIPYQQLKPREDSKKGSGLGLAICKAITEHHGGSIGVTSKEGEGSRFWFRLPVNDSRAASLV